jgi:hypothetical protein
MTTEPSGMEADLRRLTELGARLAGPKKTDRPPGWETEVVMADGRRVQGTGRTAAEATASAVVKAMELLEAPA